MMIDKSMVTRKSWEEFRQNGLLWFTNLILHMFGWSIVVKQDNNIINTIIFFDMYIILYPYMIQ